MCGFLCFDCGDLLGDEIVVVFVEIGVEIVELCVGE